MDVSHQFELLTLIKNTGSSEGNDVVPIASEFFFESRAACRRIVDAAQSGSPAAGPLIAGV